MLDHLKVLLNEPGAYSDTELYKLLNIGHKKFVEVSECLVDIITLSSVAYQGEYLLPDEGWTKILDVYFRGKILDIYNERSILRDHLNRSVVNPTDATSEIKKCYIKHRGRNRYLGLYGVPSDGATATALNGAINSSVTTITLDSVTGLVYTGALLIENEVVQYTAQSSSSVTNCIRGAENTTAASHNDDVVVTERDIFVYIVPNPVDLDADADEPQYDEAWREIPCLHAAMNAALGAGKKDKYYDFRKRFYEEANEVKAQFSYKEPGKVVRIFPATKRYLNK